MEIALIIITGLSVLGLTALGVVSLVLGYKERDKLRNLIKARDLPEYITMTEGTDEEDRENPADAEVDIDDIPFLEGEPRE
jgi:hypothetical protein